MPVSKNYLETTLKNHFPNAEIIIQDLAGDSDHYQLIIKDEIFRNKTLVNQHKLVKQALNDLLRTDLHSITIKTLIS